jgi:hypothetical protein
MQISIAVTEGNRQIHFDEEAADRISALSNLSFAVGPYRSPSESNSLLLQMTQNCPWNKCGFCGMYKGKKFKLRSVGDIKADVDTIKIIDDAIVDTSRALGFDGTVNDEVVIAMASLNPDLRFSEAFHMVLRWRASEQKTCFIQDADSMIMRGDDFIEAGRYLRETIQDIGRLTTYARSQTVYARRVYLTDISPWLERLHIGLETGDPELLRLIHKVRESLPDDVQITAGKLAKAAGFEVSEYYMPGLGGREMLEQHAIHTAKAIDEINPHYVRLRPYSSGYPGSPHSQAFADGTLSDTSRLDKLREIKLVVENLDEFDGNFCFDHAGCAFADGNGGLLFPWHYEGFKFPEQKAYVLERLQVGLGVSEEEQLRILRH